MTPYYSDDWLTVYHGDARSVLADLPAESVHCVVTSPPYWGLRDYGTASWKGGDEGCDHQKPSRQGTTSTLGAADHKVPGASHTNYTETALASREIYPHICGKCGARRIDSQLGLEPTPEQYVENMVAVFREVRRVLRSDGTVWLNLGDSYGTSDSGKGRWTHGDTSFHGERKYTQKGSGLKPKDLVGIPWRVAFALQADGWVLRSEIVWSKPNPMPESVTDRPTKSHEQLFLFSKGKRIGPDPTPYDDIPEADARWLAGIIDAEGSIVIRREGPKGNDYGGHSAQVSVGNTSRAMLDEVVRIVGSGNVLERAGQNAPMWYWQASNKVALGLLRRLYPFLIVKQRQARCAIALEEGKRYQTKLGQPEIDRRERLWQAVKSLNHFGTPDLTGIPEPVFGRWTSQPYYYDADAVREAAQDRPYRNDRATPYANGTSAHIQPYSTGASGYGVGEGGRNLRSVWSIATAPYPGAHFATFPPKLVEPCIKAGSPANGVVLDPFAGSGTTGMVAQSLSRRAVLIDLSMDYLGQLMERNREIPLGLTEEAI